MTFCSSIPKGGEAVYHLTDAQYFAYNLIFTFTDRPLKELILNIPLYLLRNSSKVYENTPYSLLQFCPQICPLYNIVPNYNNALFKIGAVYSWLSVKAFSLANPYNVCSQACPERALPPELLSQ